MTRRSLLKTLLAAPSALTFAALDAHAQAHKGKVKITNIQAMQVDNIAGNCLIKIDTDAGITGYGEAGASGPMARSRIDQFKTVLVGQDPLSIEKHLLNMLAFIHPYVAHVPTVSGIDLALWEVARSGAAGQHPARRPVPRHHQALLPRRRTAPTRHRLL